MWLSWLSKTKTYGIHKKRRKSLNIWSEMAQNSPFSPGMSRQQFKDALYNWFKDRGLFQELEIFLRQKMALKLIQQTSTPRTFSPKTQALDMLIAEHLSVYKYHYSLSVFASESNIPWNPNSSKTFLDFLQNQEQGLTKPETTTPPEPVINWLTAHQILKALDLNFTKENQNSVLRDWQMGQHSLLTCLLEREHEMSVKGQSNSTSKANSTGKANLGNSEKMEKPNSERLDDLAQLNYLTTQLQLLSQPETRTTSLPRIHPRVSLITSATQTDNNNWAKDTGPVGLLSNHQVLTLQRNHASQGDKISHLEKVVSQLKQQLQAAHDSLALAQTQLKLSHQRIADNFLQALTPTGPSVLPHESETFVPTELTQSIEKDLADTDTQISDLRKQYQSVRYSQIYENSVSAMHTKWNPTLGD